MYTLPWIIDATSLRTLGQETFGGALLKREDGSGGSVRACARTCDLIHSVGEAWLFSFHLQEFKAPTVMALLAGAFPAFDSLNWTRQGLLRASLSTMWLA